MATDEDTRTGHPVPAGVRALAAAVSDLAERPLFAVDAATTREALVEVTALESKLTAYKLALAAHAEQVQIGADTGATSTGVWWAVATRQRRSTATAQVKLGVALDTRWHRVRDALASAAMNPDQVRVVVKALEDLPEDLDTDLLAEAEEALVEFARVHDPVELTTLGAHILSVIAPEVGEELDHKRLEEAERKAEQKRRLTLSFDGHGTAHGRFQIPTAQARMLEKLLLAFASPGHLNATKTDGDDDEGSEGETGEKKTWVKGRPTAQKLGEAFCELIETYPRTTAPKLGRVDGTFIVTTSHAFLTHGIGNATLDDGTEITAAQARRLACEARIIPAVLGTQGQVLDLGLAAREFTAAQTYALHLRDGGCTAKGCDWPPGLCHAHHDTPWAHGGRTDLTNGRLLCPHHHAHIHDQTYETKTHADNQVTFHRRT